MAWTLGEVVPGLVTGESHARSTLPPTDHPLPAFDIHGIVGIVDASFFPGASDAHFPFALECRILRGGAEFRCHDHARIKQGMPAERTPFRKGERSLSFNDQKEAVVLRGVDMYTIRRSLRNDEVIAPGSYGSRP